MLKLAQLEGLGGKGAEGSQLVVLWEGVDSPARDERHTAWREGGIPQEGDGTGQLMIWEEVAFNYLCAFVASSATRDVSVSSFKYNLQIICVCFWFGFFICGLFFFKVSKASLEWSAAQ